MRQVGQVLILLFKFLAKSYYVWIILFVIYFLMASQAYHSFEEAALASLVVLAFHMGGVTLTLTFLPQIIDEIEVEVVDGKEGTTRGSARQD